MTIPLYGIVTHKVSEQRFIYKELNQHYVKTWCQLPEDGDWRIIETHNTGLRLAAKPTGQTLKLARRNNAPDMTVCDAYNINTVVIDGAIWGIPGSPTGFQVWTREDNICHVIDVKEAK